jgi:hypothetical protein
VDVRPVAGNRIKVVFETDETALFDVGPYISGSWYGQLADPAYFKTVRVAGGGNGIEWAGGQDLAPHELYAARTK